MTYEKVTLETKDGVATLTLNSPENRNSLNQQLTKDFNLALEEVRNDDNANVLVVTGVGGAFCSGGDITEMLSDATTLSKGGKFADTTNIVSHREDSYSPIILSYKLHTFPKPTIAAVNGFAVGAGFSFALTCDIRIASDKAKFSMAFVKRGFVPDIGGTYALVRLVGFARACEITYTADTIDAREAERIGVVNRVVPHEDLMKVTKEMALNIAHNPAIAVRRAKLALRQALIEPDLLTHMRYEQLTNRLLMDTEDSKEGLRSFIEKREPKYTGKW